MLLLAVSTMFITMGQGIVVPILPLLVQSFGLAAAMVGVAVSAFALARVFANIPAGFLTRHRGARDVLFVGALLSALGNLMVALAPGYGSLIAFRFVAGLGSAMFITAAVAFVAEVSTPANRGRLMTIYQAAFLLGITLGPSLGGIVAELFGLHAPFLLVAGVSALAGIWTFLKIPRTVAQVSRPSTPAPTGAEGPAFTAERSVFRNAGFIAVSLIALGVFFTRGGALFTLWPLLGQQRFHLGAAALGLLFVVPSATNLVCQPFVGALVDRLGRKTLIVPTVVLFAVALLLSAVAPTVAVLAIAMALYGIGQAIEAPTANSYVADLAPARERAVALGVYRTFGDVGLVVGSPLLGLIGDHAGLSWGLVTNAGLILVPGALFWFVAKETPGLRPSAAVRPSRDSPGT